MQYPRVERGKRIQRSDRAVAKLKPVAVEKRERLADAAFGCSNGSCNQRILCIFADRRRGGERDLRLRQRTQLEDAATGANGREHASRGVTHQQQQGSRWRLL